MTNVYEFPEGSPLGHKENPKEQYKQRARKQGALSMDNLRRSRKLNNADRKILARNLYDALSRYDVKTTEIASAADINLKDFYRLLLPEGRDRWVTGNSRRYESAIHALSRLTHRNLNSLADHLLKGTSLHPSRVENHSEAEKLQLAIQGLVDHIDRDFLLLQCYSKIAVRKAEEIQSGGTDNWPFLPLEKEWDDNIEHKARRYSDPENAFYEEGYDELSRPFFEWNILEDALPYLPRMYLGEMLNLRSELQIKSGAVDRMKYRDAIEKLRTEMLSWERIRAFVSPEQRTKSTWTDWYSAWLVIYPSPDLSSLSPILLVSYEEWGVFALALSSEFLSELKDWDCITDHAQSGYERIVDAVTSGELRESWSSTAPDIKGVGYLRRSAESEARSNAVDAVYRQYWKDENND